MSPEAESRQTKTCEKCGRSFEWRRKWAKDWPSVRYCSDKCRRSGLTDFDRELERAIEKLLDSRSADSSICPSDVARKMGGDDWRSLMEPVRAAARRLVARNEVQIVQQGRVVNPSSAKGPIRIRRPR